MKKRAFLVHGWEGSPTEGWRPWLKGELEKEGFEVIVPAMPDPKHPKMRDWVPFLANIVGESTEGDYFVGHSLGCITILRFLENMKESEKIGGAVLIAGFTDDLGYPELATFFETPINWTEIKRHGDKFISIVSSDDPYVPLKYGEVFKMQLGAQVKVEYGLKHFSGDDGIMTLPAAKKAVLDISSK